MEPNISDQAYAALYAPTAGIVCPFNLNIAMAENANVNGVEFKFDTEVTDLKPIDSGCIYHVPCLKNSVICMDFPFKKNGSLVVCLHEEDMPNLQALYDRGVANGVKELRILNCKELKEMEPNISRLHMPSLYNVTALLLLPHRILQPR